MICHIVPVAYMSEWATTETKGKKRDKRKYYIIKKNCIEVSCRKIVEVSDDTIFKTDLYIENNDDFIENQMNKLYESGWRRFVARLDKEVYKNVDNEIPLDDYILRFITLQIYRTEEYMKQPIHDTCEIINRVIPSEFNIKLEENSIFLRMLREFLNNQDCAMTTTFSELKNNYNKVFLISEIEFLSGDLPAYKIDNDNISRGFYFPVSPRICLFMYESPKSSIKTHKNNAMVRRVSNSVAELVNSFTYDRAKNIAFSSTSEMKKITRNDRCSEADFKHVLE